MIKKIFTFLAPALFLVSCSLHNDTFSGRSAIHLNVTTDLSYKVSEGDCNVGRADFNLSSVITVPSVSDFKMTLYSVVGEGVENAIGSWNSVDDFENGAQYSPGEYHVEVASGSLTDKGENKPYFYGSEYFQVKPDETTTVNVVAELCNSFVKVTTTEDFKEYFTSGTLTIIASGKDDVVLSPLANSTPVFVAPGIVSLEWKGVRQGGNVKAVVASDLQLDAKTGYTINLDVNASNNQIVVQYDNDVTKVAVDLVASSDPVIELPYVVTEGFDSGALLKFSKTSPVTGVRFIMVADGNIKDCVLTLNAATATALQCDETMSLISSTVQSFLRIHGLEIKGLDKNREKMAYVDFSNMLSGMPVGSYSFSMTVTDSYNRTSAPMVLKVNVTE